VGLSQYPGDEACKSGMETSWAPSIEEFKDCEDGRQSDGQPCFWGHKGVLLLDAMQQGTTINAGAYCTTLLLLSAAIKRNRLGCLRKVFFSNEYFNIPSNTNMYVLFKNSNMFRCFGFA
jgi:hypothetical protein